MTENNVSLNDFLDEPELTIPDESPEPEPEPVPEQVTQGNFMNTIMKNLHKLTPDERSQIMKYFQEQQSQTDPKQRLKDKLALKRNMRTKKQLIMKKIDEDDKKQEMIQQIMKKLNIKF
jgi:mRNA-degrading endonuclease RelE of RelBE toxin-antitoxin system